VKTASLLLLLLLLSLSLSLLSSLLLPSLPSLLLPLPVSMAPSKKKEVKGATTPPGLLSELCQKLKTDNIELPPMVEKKLVFGNNTKMKLKNYEIDWFNPEVITSKSIKYLKKIKVPQAHMKANCYSS
jgi:hypothetical protein